MLPPPMIAGRFRFGCRRQRRTRTTMVEWLISGWTESTESSLCALVGRVRQRVCTCRPPSAACPEGLPPEAENSLELPSVCDVWRPLDVSESLLEIVAHPRPAQTRA